MPVSRYFRAFAAAALLLLTAWPCRAQAPRLEELRSYDHKLQAQIDQLDQGGEAAQYGPFYRNDLTLNVHGHPWPAVGIYQARYHFYYDHEDGQGAGEPRPDPDRLRKVVLEYDVSDRHYRFDLLYNLRGGLILYREEVHGAVQEVGFSSGHPLSPAPPDLCKRALALGLQASRLFRESLRFQP